MFPIISFYNQSMGIYGAVPWEVWNVWVKFFESRGFRGFCGFGLINGLV